MADRSRRERKSNLNKLAEYKRAREGGSRSWKQEEDTDLYDEVSEDQYKSIVRGRLAKDDFVVDDGISGYMDNGMDDWGAGDEERADSEEESTKNNKCNVSLLRLRTFGSLCLTHTIQQRKRKARVSTRKAEENLKLRLLPLFPRSLHTGLQNSQSRKKILWHPSWEI